MDGGLTGRSGPEKLRTLALRLLPALVLSFACEAILLPVFGQPWNPVRSLIVSTIALFLLAAATWTLRQLLISTIVLLVTGVLLLFLRERVAPFIDETIRGFTAAREPEAWLAQHSSRANLHWLLLQQRRLGDLIRWLIVLPAYLLAGRFRRPVTALLFGIVIIVVGAYNNQEGLLLPSLLILIAVIWVALAAQRRRVADLAPTQPWRLTRETLLIAVLAVSLALVPAVLIQTRIGPADLYNAHAHAFVDDLTYLLPDSWIAPYHFRLFTIRDAGYYPYGDRLGGTVELNDRPVFTLEGETAGLLRGQSSRIYTGFNWSVDREQTSFRFENPMFRAERDAIWPPFTSDSVAAALGGDRVRVRELDYRVTMLTDRLQTYMIGGRPTEISLEGNQPYLTFIDESGTLNATRAFNPDQVYQVRSENLDLGRWFVAAAGRDQALPYGTEEADPTHLADELAEYLQLPDTPPYRPGGTVYEAARAVGIRGALGVRFAAGYPETLEVGGERGAGAVPQDRLSRVLRLRDWLQSMHYSLEVVDVPEGQDFVEHVLATQSGYCVYYASALAVLCRTLGIPARYVEGFAVGGEREGAVVLASPMKVTNRSAHAWTEVYFDGIGWLPVDPTPGEGLREVLPEPPVATPTPEPEETTAPPTPTPTSPPPTPTSPPDGPRPPKPTEPTPRSEPESPASVILTIVARLFLILLALLVLYYLLQKLLRYRLRRWQRLLHPADMRQAWPELSPAELILLYWDAILILLREVASSSLGEAERARLRRRGLTLREEVAILAAAPAVGDAELLRQDLLGDLALAEEAAFGSASDLPGLERASVDADQEQSTALHNRLYRLASLAERLMDRFTLTRSERALRHFFIVNSYGLRSTRNARQALRRRGQLRQLRLPRWPRRRSR
ncbi:MAG: transglutaminase-like domain-containing protein [Bacillota bacterium]|nr:transglutaminase-like domain-containing protein [Bacillota bacterium]